MVVVVVQYRLAALGWFSHPAFREGQDAANASGNYGTLDHIQALKWVRKNIAAFGGDSRKVTIGGLSAGGHNVMNLMISPQAKGLFSGVVAVSPAVESMMPLRSFKETDAAADKIIDWLLVKDGKAADAEAAKAYRVSMSNADIRAYLLGQPAEAILRAARDGVGQGSMPSYPAPQGRHGASRRLLDGSHRSRKIQQGPAHDRHDGVRVLQFPPLLGTRGKGGVSRPFG